MSTMTRLGVLSTLAALSACLDSAAPSASQSSAPVHGRRFTASMRTGLPIDVPAVDMDLPLQLRAWDTSDVALANAIDAEGGHAIIAFKELAAAKTLRNQGHRSAVSAATVNAALTMLRARGVQVVQYLDAIGAAHVVVSGTLAAQLNNSGFVDYVEPRQRGSIAGTPAIFKRSATTAMLGQTTPWGISLVRAPEAWSVSRGAGVGIEIIDTGHQQGHEDLPYVPSANCAGSFGGCDDGYPVPHGSHVSGIFLARDNGLGVVGVANGIDGSNVYEFGACSNITRECDVVQVTTGINAAIFDARVINLSLRQPYDVAQSNAVARHGPTTS